MDFKELEDYLQNLPDKILDDASEIVAETAVEHFKDSFNKKAYNDNPWRVAQLTKNVGSLLVTSGALLKSIQPKLISRELVVISAGNQKVKYAKAHNEGFKGSVNVKAHKRKDSKVKAHTRDMNIPQRQFMGKSDQLAKIIYKRLKEHLKTIEKK